MTEKTHTGIQQSAEHAKAFPPLDPTTFPSQLIWLAITFGLLYILVRRVMLPPLGEVVKERSSRINADLRLTEELKNEAEAALTNYNRALGEARARANDTANGMREKLAVETNEQRAKVETNMAAMLAEAETRIAAAKAKAFASVSEIASDVASAVVTRLIDKEVT